MYACCLNCRYFWRSPMECLPDKCEYRYYFKKGYPDMTDGGTKCKCWASNQTIRDLEKETPNDLR